MMLSFYASARAAEHPIASITHQAPRAQSESSLIGRQHFQYKNVVVRLGVIGHRPHMQH